MQISSFVSDSYIINLCLGYQLCLICPLILLYFLTLLHRNPGIFSPYVWTLPSKSYLPFCLKQEYSYLCGQGGDVTHTYTKNYYLIYYYVSYPSGMFLGPFSLFHIFHWNRWWLMALLRVATYSPVSLNIRKSWKWTQLCMYKDSKIYFLVSYNRLFSFCLIWGQILTYPFYAYFLHKQL